MLALVARMAEGKEGERREREFLFAHHRAVLARFREWRASKGGGELGDDAFRVARKRVADLLIGDLGLAGRVDRGGKLLGVVVRPNLEIHVAPEAMDRLREQLAKVETAPSEPPEPADYSANVTVRSRGASWTSGAPWSVALPDIVERVKPRDLYVVGTTTQPRFNTHHDHDWARLFNTGTRVRAIAHDPERFLRSHLGAAVPKDWRSSDASSVPRRGLGLDLRSWFFVVDITQIARHTEDALDHCRSLYSSLSDPHAWKRDNGTSGTSPRNELLQVRRSRLLHPWSATAWNLDSDQADGFICLEIFLAADRGKSDFGHPDRPTLHVPAGVPLFEPLRESILYLWSEGEPVDLGARPTVASEGGAHASRSRSSRG